LILEAEKKKKEVIEALLTILCLCSLSSIDPYIRNSEKINVGRIINTLFPPILYRP